jgi:hypothetical protein
MIFPRWWILKRPGIFLPVFFLSLLFPGAAAQVCWSGAAPLAMGGAYVTCDDYTLASQNQAGLGQLDQHSITIQHSRPFLLRELGVSSLFGQFHTGHGALGIALTTYGIRSLRQQSMWLSYGLQLNASISAGLGIHFWNTSIAEQLIYSPGTSFALGLQVKLTEHWILGAHLLHPVVWSAPVPVERPLPMTLVSGCQYTFFKVGKIITELHMTPANMLILSGGLEWQVRQDILLRTGVCSRPFTFSWGISLKFGTWISEFSFQYRTGSGSVPLSSLTHAW